VSSILIKLFEHHRWANLRTVEACAGSPSGGARTA
jgi:hypothetical protein